MFGLRVGAGGEEEDDDFEAVGVGGEGERGEACERAAASGVGWKNRRYMSDPDLSLTRDTPFNVLIVPTIISRLEFRPIFNQRPRQTLMPFKARQTQVRGPLPIVVPHIQPQFWSLVFIRRIAEIDEFLGQVDSFGVDEQPERGEFGVFLQGVGVGSLFA